MATDGGGSVAGVLAAAVDAPAAVLLEPACELILRS